MPDLSTRVHPLDGARLKVARAEEHIGELRLEIRTYLERHADVPPPVHLNVVIGDGVWNLRASLDLTFWALALQTGPKDRDRDRIFFPIFSSEMKFRAAEVGFARYVSPQAADVIEQVQPFRTKNAALSLLRTLWNHDRHGFLALARRTKVAGDQGETAFVAFEDATLSVGSVDVILNAIARHIKADVLPKFEPLFA